MSSKISAEQRAVSALVSSEAALNSADFARIQDEVFQLNIQFFPKNFEVSLQRGSKI